MNIKIQMFLNIYGLSYFLKVTIIFVVLVMMISQFILLEVLKSKIS